MSNVSLKPNQFVVKDEDNKLELYFSLENGKITIARYSDDIINENGVILSVEMLEMIYACIMNHKELKKVPTKK